MIENLDEDRIIKLEAEVCDARDSYVRIYDKIIKNFEKIKTWNFLRLVRIVHWTSNSNYTIL